MSGVDRLMAESNDRWAKATRRAQGVADNGLGKALRTYFILYFPVGLLVLILVGAGVTASFSGLAWLNPLNLQFGLMLAALGAFVGGLLYNAKRVRPAAHLGIVSVTMSLETHEQKHVRRQYLGKTPIEAQHLPVTRAAAVQQRKNIATQLLILPMLPLVVIPLALPGTTTIWWLNALVVFFNFIAAIFLVREFRQTGRFLAYTAGDPSNQST